MDWVPIVFVVFKVLVFGSGMFFAIKWHYDQGKKRKDTRALLLAGGKIVAVLMLLLAGLLIFTFGLARTLGMDLRLP